MGRFSHESIDLTINEQRNSVPRYVLGLEAGPGHPDQNCTHFSLKVDPIFPRYVAVQAVAIRDCIVLRRRMTPGFGFPACVIGVMNPTSANPWPTSCITIELLKRVARRWSSSCRRVFVVLRSNGPMFRRQDYSYLVSCLCVDERHCRFRNVVVELFITGIFVDEAEYGQSSSAHSGDEGQSRSVEVNCKNKGMIVELLQN